MQRQQILEAINMKNKLTNIIIKVFNTSTSNIIIKVTTPIINSTKKKNLPIKLYKNNQCLP